VIDVKVVASGSRNAATSTVAPDQELDAVCRALAHPVRRRLLNLLRKHPCTTSRLCAALGPDAPSRYAVMQHLKILESAGLIVSLRHGRARSNHLNPLPLQRFYQRWLRRFQRLKPAHLLLMRTWPGRRPDRPVASPPWQSRR
jgi:DNA-binding transcriptional ArsR family regulator